MDLLVIGAGLSGSIIANAFAKKKKKVLVLEKRDHCAGNIYDKTIDGIVVHAYGPHIFHTNSDRVFNFMNQFWELNDFSNVVGCNIDNTIIPLPFNFKGIDKFWPRDAKKIKNILVNDYGINSRISILELLQNNSPLIEKVAKFIYKNIFLNYTIKMWDTDPRKIDTKVLKRVPIIIGYNDKYFADKYEGIPKKGYTNTIKKMLSNKNIEVKTGVDALNFLELKNGKVFFEKKEITTPIIYSGPIDELFNYVFGALNYRSLNIEFETINKPKFQATAVVNYPSHPTMTRITEYKYMTKQISKKTIISKEFPGQFSKNDPIFNKRFYPLPTMASKSIYKKYLALSKKYKNLHLIGRLATYKYINMDQAIDFALDKVEELGF